MTGKSDSDTKPKKKTLAGRAGLGVLGAAIGTVAGYFIFGDAFGMAGSAFIVGLGLAMGLGGGHDGGMDGGGGD